MTRGPYRKGHVELVPSHFSEVPLLMEHATRCSLVLAAASPPDRHGYFSLGTNADYVASFIGKVPFFLETTPAMPRTHGRNQLHVSQIAGYAESERPLLEVPRPTVSPEERRIAEYVVEHPGRGHDPGRDRRDPRGRARAAREPPRPGRPHRAGERRHRRPLRTRGHHRHAKVAEPGKIVTTFALGSARLYDFLADNPSVELWPVSYVNNPRVIAREEGFVSINGTLEVDLLGQCASESIGSKYYSGSGGQSDFARGCINAKGGRGLHRCCAPPPPTARSRASGPS